MLFIVPWVAIEGEGAVFFVEGKINVRDYKIIDDCVRRGENT